MASPCCSGPSNTTQCEKVKLGGVAIMTAIATIAVIGSALAIVSMHGHLPLTDVANAVNTMRPEHIYMIAAGSVTFSLITAVTIKAVRDSLNTRFSQKEIVQLKLNKETDRDQLVANQSFLIVDDIQNSAHSLHWRDENGAPHFAAYRVAALRDAHVTKLVGYRDGAMFNADALAQDINAIDGQCYILTDGVLASYATWEAAAQQLAKQAFDETGLPFHEVDEDWWYALNFEIDGDTHIAYWDGYVRDRVFVDVIPNDAVIINDPTNPDVLDSDLIAEKYNTPFDRHNALCSKLEADSATSGNCKRFGIKVYFRITTDEVIYSLTSQGQDSDIPLSVAYALKENTHLKHHGATYEYTAANGIVKLDEGQDPETTPLTECAPEFFAGFFRRKNKVEARLTELGPLALAEGEHALYTHSSSGLDVHFIVDHEGTVTHSVIPREVENGLQLLEVLQRLDTSGLAEGELHPLHGAHVTMDKAQPKPFLLESEHAGREKFNDIHVLYVGDQGVRYFETVEALRAARDAGGYVKQFKTAKTRASELATRGQKGVYVERHNEFAYIVTVNARGKRQADAVATNELEAALSEYTDREDYTLLTDDS